MRTTGRIPLQLFSALAALALAPAAAAPLYAQTRGDAPMSKPVASTSRAAASSRLADAARTGDMAVVRAESTTQPMVLESVSLLDRSKEIRCILNQAQSTDLAEYYYGYGKSNHEAEEG